MYSLKQKFGYVFNCEDIHYCGNLYICYAILMKNCFIFQSTSVSPTSTAGSTSVTSVTDEPTSEFTTETHELRHLRLITSEFTTETPVPTTRTMPTTVTYNKDLISTEIGIINFSFKIIVKIYK